MDIEDLRTRLFSEMELMTKDDMAKELEDAGYKIRRDLSGSGILNPDGSCYGHGA